jgi:multidrug resistance efflux pump
MLAQGLIAKDALETDQKAASEARYEAAQAARDAEDAASRLRLIQKGFDAALAKLENMMPARHEDSVAMARADVGVREAHLRALNLRHEDLIVRSPCDCVVEAFYSTTGEHAKKGDLVAQLRAREAQELTVEALVNQDDADRIAIGSKSEIVLPTGNTLVTGKVVEINRVPKHAKRTGLPDRTPDLHGYAAVTIAPDKDLKGVELGMPVEVRLRSNTLKRLVQSVAGAFGRHESTAYAGD